MILVTPSSSILKARAGCSTSQSSLTPLISKLFSPLNYLNSNASIVAPPSLPPSLALSTLPSSHLPPSPSSLPPSLGRAKRSSAAIQTKTALERTNCFACRRASERWEGKHRARGKVNSAAKVGRAQWKNETAMFTGAGNKACAWLQEVYSSSILTLLPGHAQFSS